MTPRLFRALDRAGWVILAGASLYIGAHIVAALTHTDPATVIGWTAGLVVGLFLIFAAIASHIKA